MTYKEKVERYNTATAQALVAKWNDAHSRMKACKLEKEEAEAEMVMHVCPYKLGEIFADKKGKKYALTRISVNDYALRGGYDENGEKYIDFSYKFVAIRKDGHLSMNGSTWVNGEMLPIKVCSVCGNVNPFNALGDPYYPVRCDRCGAKLDGEKE
jgi:hypothetical protein